MSNIGSSYSQVINPMDYNHIVSNEHIYISAADRFLVKKIMELKNTSAEIVELGCGPGRAMALVSEIEGINLTGIDLDNQFLDCARSLVTKPHVKIINADVENYKHYKEVDIFYSHGLHHHVSKGLKTLNYLKNACSNLKMGGYYILIDEFLPEYKNSKGREVKVVIWYSHVIAHAIRNDYSYLAQEESKIFLDDLFEGRSIDNIKNQQQINFVLSKAQSIDEAAKASNLSLATKLAEDFLTELEAYYNITPQGDTTLDLSRGDYKICDSVFREEIKNTNFKIDSIRSFGPIELIGAVSVYILKKE